MFYWSAYDIGGFQFSIDGVGVASASGGAVDELGFDLSIGTGYLLGVSLTNDAIPAGSGLLTTLSIDWYTTPGEVCLNNLTVSDATGVSALDFDASGCQDRFCEDADFDVVCDCLLYTSPSPRDS